MAARKKQPRKRGGNKTRRAAARPNLQEIPRANAPSTGEPPGLGAIETELRLGAYAPALVETFVGALGAAFATRAYRHLTEPRRLVVFVGHVGMHSGAPVLHVTDELERTEDGRVLARPSCSPEHVGPAVKTWPVTRLKETRDALMAGAHWCRRCEELAKVQVEEFAKRRAESFAAGGGIIGPTVKHEPPAEPKPADPAPAEPKPAEPALRVFAATPTIRERAQAVAVRDPLSWGTPLLHVARRFEYRTRDSNFVDQPAEEEKYARPLCDPKRAHRVRKAWRVTESKLTATALERGGARWCAQCKPMADKALEDGEPTKPAAQDDIFAMALDRSTWDNPAAAGGGIIGPTVKHEPPALNCARCDAAPEIHPRKTHNFFTVSCPKCSWTLIARHKTNAVVGWNDHQMLLQRASPCSKCGMRPRINASSHGVALTCCGYATPARTTEHALAQWNEHAVDNPAAAEAPIGPERAQKLMDDLNATSAMPPHPNATLGLDADEFDVTEAVIEKAELALGRMALCSRCGTAPKIYRRSGLYRVRCPTCRYTTLRFDSVATPVGGWNRSNPAPKPTVSAAAMEAADALSRELGLRGNDLVVRQAAAHPTVESGQVYEDLRTGIRVTVGAENAGLVNVTYLDDAGGYTIPPTDLLDQTKFRRLFKFSHLWQHEPDTTDRRVSQSCDDCSFVGTRNGEPACNLDDRVLPMDAGPAPDWCRLRQGPVLVTLEEK